MDDLLSRLDSDTIIPVVVVPTVFLFLAICVIAGHWLAHRRSELDASLKQDMLDRGMSADEIEKVLKAKSG